MDDGENSDILLWCNDCNISHGLSCPSCPPIIIPDSRVPSRAEASLPKSLLLHRDDSEDPPKVLAREVIKKRTRFGPMEAPVSTTSKEDRHKINFLIFRKESSPMVFDTSDEDKCNWMCLVTMVTASSLPPANLVCYQHQDAIYFLTTKEIVAGEELRVIYEQNYGAKITEFTSSFKADSEFDARPDGTNCDEDNVSDMTIDETVDKHNKESFAVDTKDNDIDEDDNKDVDDGDDDDDEDTHHHDHYVDDEVDDPEEADDKSDSDRTVSFDLCNTRMPCSDHDDLSSDAVNNTDESKKEQQMTDVNTNKSLGDDKCGNDVMTDDKQESDDYRRSDMKLDQCGIFTDGLHRKVGCEFHRYATRQQSKLGSSKETKKLLLGTQTQEQSSNSGTSLCDANRTGNQVIDDGTLKYGYNNTDKSMLADGTKCDKRDDICAVREKLSRCEKCAKDFRSQRLLRSHMRIHVERKYACKICSLRFNSSSVLRLHFSTHQKSVTSVDGNKVLMTVKSDKRRKIVCDKCGYEFMDLHAFIKHYKTIHNRDVHPCIICRKTFNSPDELALHANEHSSCNADHEYLGTADVIFACDSCPAVFYNQSSLLKHATKHSGQKPYLCDVCGKRFKSKKAVTQHRLTVHKKEKNYMCAICHKRLKSKRSLQIHLSIHTADKNYKCDKCGKTFASRGNLNLHATSHLMEKEFKCDVCKKSLKTHISLKRHIMRMHGELKFKCDRCNHSFTTDYDLRIHVRRIHDGHRAWGCEICPRDTQWYKTSTGYRKHMKKIHDNLKPEDYRPIRGQYVPRDKSHRLVTKVRDVGKRVNKIAKILPKECDVKGSKNVSGSLRPTSNLINKDSVVPPIAIDVGASRAVVADMGERQDSVRNTMLSVQQSAQSGAKSDKHVMRIEDQNQLDSLPVCASRAEKRATVHNLINTASNSSLDDKQAGSKAYRQVKSQGCVNLIHPGSETIDVQKPSVIPTISPTLPHQKIPVATINTAVNPGTDVFTNSSRSTRTNVTCGSNPSDFVDAGVIQLPNDILQVQSRLAEFGSVGIPNAVTIPPAQIVTAKGDGSNLPHEVASVVQQLRQQLGSGYSVSLVSSI